MLAEKSFERTNIKNDSTKMLSKKCIRKNSHSKCPHRNASWKNVRENYQYKGVYWNAAQSLPTKTVIQNVRNEILAEKPSEKTNNKNDGTKMLSKNVSAETVVRNVRTEMLGEKASKKTTIKMTVLKSGPKRYSQKLSVKKSVPKS